LPITPFFAHFDAKFDSSLGESVSELPTILPKLSRSEIDAPGMLVSERSQPHQLYVAPFYVFY
jgi:hypothetical protein